MKKSQSGDSIYLYYVYFFWTLALFFFIIDYSIFYKTTALFALIFGFFHIKRCFFMFRKSGKQTPLNSDIPDNTFEFDLTEDTENFPKTEGGKRSTVIAKDTVIKGNIEVDGDIRLYGEIIGNINVQQGCIRIMPAGHVDGELKAPAIIIDGQVDGLCYAKTIDILEHGELRGTSRCESLSIKQGGVFIGQSEKIDENIKDNDRITKFTSVNNLENVKKEIIVSDPVELLSNLPPAQASKK